MRRLTLKQLSVILPGRRRKDHVCDHEDSVRLALFDGRERVSQHDIELAFQEQAMGSENPIEEMQEDQRRQVAYHEAGHAIIQYYLLPDERIVRVSIVRRSEALGYVLPVSNYDIYGFHCGLFSLIFWFQWLVMWQPNYSSANIGPAPRSISKVFTSCGNWRIMDILVRPLDGIDAGKTLWIRRNDIIDIFWGKLEEQTAQILATCCRSSCCCTGVVGKKRFNR